MSVGNTESRGEKSIHSKPRSKRDVIVMMLDVLFGERCIEATNDEREIFHVIAVSQFVRRVCSEFVLGSRSSKYRVAYFHIASQKRRQNRERESGENLFTESVRRGLG
jgi:hypothetical protein